MCGAYIVVVVSGILIKYYKLFYQSSLYCRESENNFKFVRWGASTNLNFNTLKCKCVQIIKFGVNNFSTLEVNLHTPKTGTRR